MITADAASVEAYLAERLVAAGEWESARASDGVSALRVVEQGEGRLVVAGQVWTIDQRLHSFWLCVDGARWTLHYDLDEQAGQRWARDAMYQDDPAVVPWRVTLASE